jgi:hypothetical protein
MRYGFQAARVVLLLASLVTLGAAARAQDAPVTENGRYTMTPTEGGFMRLDTRTGAVSLCTATKASVECRLAPDERTALQQEIDRLAKENAELKTRVAVAPAPRPSIPLPNKDEMDRALNFAESFMRRMMRIMREETPPDRI